MAVRLIHADTVTFVGLGPLAVPTYFPLENVRQLATTPAAQGGDPVIVPLYPCTEKSLAVVPVPSSSFHHPTKPGSGALSFSRSDNTRLGTWPNAGMAMNSSSRHLIARPPSLSRHSKTALACRSPDRPLSATC